ncbi:luc7-like protein 3 [Palaemon carinicauda]|uniref:luc7-like protein 3 n=1 Tax=Palaemon carinicauda TaxID=392227 RepID=UPI0035B6AAF7
MSGMIKPQIKCPVLEALINSGKLSEENIVAAHELLEEAEEEFLVKQEPVDPQTEGMKADGYVDAEIRRNTVEETLLKLKMMAEQEERERRREEMEARREEEREEKRRAKELEARWEEREAEREENEQEAAHEITRQEGDGSKGYHKTRRKKEKTGRNESKARR